MFEVRLRLHLAFMREARKTERRSEEHGESSVF
jgi:hypothetical protein